MVKYDHHIAQIMSYMVVHARKLVEGLISNTRALYYHWAKSLLSPITMTTISEFLEMLSAVPEIGSYHVTETRLGWKDALLSGNKGNDLVDLYLCQNKKNNTALISFSEFIEGDANNTISDMVDANLISLGYPMVYIEEALGLKDIPVEISYSLLYRSASVILEAERLNIRDAILVLVGSNSATTENKAFHSFATLLCDESEKNLLHKCALKSRVNFYFGLFDSTSN